MTVAIVVPARFASTRYPGKPLAALIGADGASKTLIERSWEAAMRVPDIAYVAVATDDERIADAALAFGAHTIVTPPGCANGTERCAAVLPALPSGVDIVVNLQGDAPLTPSVAIERIVAALHDALEAQVATPAIRATPALHRRLLDDAREGRVGGTTLVCNAGGEALYFSRAVIPHVPPERVGDPALPVFLHLGVYAYRRTALESYAAAPPCALEELEGLEQLRFLENGIAVRVVEIDVGGADIWELNNPCDRAPIEAALVAQGIA